MYDDYIGGHLSNATRAILTALTTQNTHTLNASTTTAHSALTPTNSSTQALTIPNTSQDVDELQQQQAHNMFVNPFAPPSTSSAESSSQYVDPLKMHTFYQSYQHDYQWTKDHSLEQVIGEPSQPVLTRNQLWTDDEMCIYTLSVSTIEPSNVKKAMIDPRWIDSMQEELLQFKWLNVSSMLKSKLCLQAEKALYGLKQALRAWNALGQISTATLSRGLTDWIANLTLQGSSGSGYEWFWAYCRQKDGRKRVLYVGREKGVAGRIANLTLQGSSGSGYEWFWAYCRQKDGRKRVLYVGREKGVAGEQ
nr:hypothetical protein [Tanacetum cinerariifolium]